MASITVERDFTIHRAKMWALWTDEEHASRWMRPSIQTFAPTIATIDPRPGGAYRFEMVAADGTVRAAVGTFIELVEPERLTFTWTWEGSGEASLVEVVLTEIPGGTRVRILHTELASQETADQHEHGWSGCLESLAVLY